MSNDGIFGGNFVLIDVTGVVLLPGAFGRDCCGNGSHFASNGDAIECCCDECDYLKCCTDDDWQILCRECGNADCPSSDCAGTI